MQEIRVSRRIEILIEWIHHVFRLQRQRGLIIKVKVRKGLRLKSDDEGAIECEGRYAQEGEMEETQSFFFVHPHIIS